MKLTRDHKLALGVYLACAAVYALTAGVRLKHPSSDIHFSYQAKMFLERRLDLGHAAPSSNDWAEVEYLTLKDGRTVAGSWLRAQSQRFRMLDGKVEMIGDELIASRSKKYYVSFPPFPAVLFLPFVALWGLRVNDVALTIALAALVPPLLFLLFRRLSRRGDSERSENDDLWLTAMFAFGTVFFYASVQGQVWYTAHVVSLVCSALFLHCSLEARRPFLAGLCLGALLLTRPPMAALGTFLLYELWRKHEDGVPWARLLPRLVACALPVLLFGAVGFWFNHARFGAFGEFGHSYLNVRWTDRIQRYGLENLAFLSRNLTCAFTMTPKLINRPPFVLLSWHGMAILLTTPALAYLLWPRVKGHLHRALWITLAPTALLGFLYQNDGWVQFGYRFSLDFTLPMMLLLAIGGRRLTPTFRALILVGIAVNLYGAITFGRAWQFYHEGFFPIAPSEY